MKNTTEDIIDIPELINTCFKYFYILIITISLGVVGSYIYYKNSTKRYAIETRITLAFSPALLQNDTSLKLIQTITPNETISAIEDYLNKNVNDNPKTTYRITASNKTEYPIIITIVTDDPQNAKILLTNLLDNLNNSPLIKERISNYHNVLNNLLSNYKNYKKEAIYQMSKLPKNSDKSGYLTLINTLDESILSTEYELNNIGKYIFLKNPTILNKGKPVAPYLPLYIFLGTSIGTVSGISIIVSLHRNKCTDKKAGNKIHS